jgi:autotransporter family porin
LYCLRKIAPIAALLAGFSPAFAQTVIDASSDLSWRASISGTTSDTVIITGDGSIFGSGPAIYFDLGGNWYNIINNGSIMVRYDGDGTPTVRGTNFSNINIINNGTIERLGAGNGDVINLETDNPTADISVTNNGYIHAEVSNGIELRGGNNITVVNSQNGTIQGDSDRSPIFATKFVGVLNITNEGTIISPISPAVIVELTGVSTSMMTITNNGSITGGWFLDQNPTGTTHNYTLLNNGVVNPGSVSVHGVRFTGAERVDTVSFTNNGSIIATADGFSLGNLVGSATVVNTGTLQGGATGGSRIGISINAEATATAISISNSGVIQGTSYGIYVLTADTATRTDIMNTGTITGGNGTAILFSTGVNTLTLDTGSILNGNVRGSAGSSDSVLLRGTGTEDSDFIAIENFNMQGSDWTLSGTLAFQNASIESGVLRLHTGSLTSTQISIQPGAMLDTSAGNYSMTGHLENAGHLQIGHYGGTPGNTLSVSSYTGNGGVVVLNTALGDDLSATDRLIVTGDTAGHSRLQIINAGGSGGQTRNGIEVVRVQGQSNGVFSLAAPVQAGIHQYTLRQNATNWSLVTATGSNGTAVYRPAVSAYVAGQRIDADLGFQQLASLHQRVGEHRILPSTRQSWARAWSSRTHEEGRRAFGYTSRSSGLQVGQEVLASTNASGGLSRAAFSLDYVRSDADFEDRHRASAGLGRKSASLDAQSLALGAYFTYGFQGGSYIDVAGQVATLRNRFRDTYGGHGTQTGWRGGVSVESGLPLGAFSGWTVEPQFQLAYHVAQYRGFDDDVSRISSYTADALRARLGARVFRDLAAGQKLHVYGMAHVVGDLLDPKRVKVGKSAISEGYGKSWGEVGVGVQGWVSKSTALFGEIRYQQGFAGKDEKREGGSLNIGLRHGF